MDLLGKKKRVSDEADLDITPMIDVTFLLLIFFMVASTMKPEAPIDIAPADTGKGMDPSKAIIVTILMVGDEAKMVCSDGDGVEASMDRVREYIREEIVNGKESLLIKADRDVPNGVWIDVAREAKKEKDDLKYHVAVRDKK